MPPTVVCMVLRTLYSISTDTHRRQQCAECSYSYGRWTHAPWTAGSTICTMSTDAVAIKVYFRRRNSSYQIPIHLFMYLWRKVRLVSYGAWQSLEPFNLNLSSPMLLAPSTSKLDLANKQALTFTQHDDYYENPWTCESSCTVCEGIHKLRWGFGPGI